MSVGFAAHIWILEELLTSPFQKKHKLIKGSALKITLPGETPGTAIPILGFTCTFDDLDIPFPYVQKRVRKMADFTPTTDLNPDHEVPMHRIRFMIQMAARYVPSSTCLVQALAGYILFSKYGYTTLIKIGVLNEDGQFEAHAWLERGDEVVLGESERDYKTILDIDGTS